MTITHYAIALVADLTTGTFSITVASCAVIGLADLATTAISFGAAITDFANTANTQFSLTALVIGIADRATVIFADQPCGTVLSFATIADDTGSIVADLTRCTFAIIGTGRAKVIFADHTLLTIGSFMTIATNTRAFLANHIDATFAISQTSDTDICPTDLVFLTISGNATLCDYTDVIDAEMSGITLFVALAFDASMVFTYVSAHTIRIFHASLACEILHITNLCATAVVVFAATSATNTGLADQTLVAIGICIAGSADLFLADLTTFAISITATFSYNTDSTDT